MTPSDVEPPNRPHAESVRELLHDPRIRELLGDVLIEELETRRAPRLWTRVQPLIAGAASAMVTILVFFLPSLQEQWDRYQSRQVIQRYADLGRAFMRDGRYRLAEETFAKAFELSENQRLDIEEERLAARVEQVNVDPEWGKQNPEGIAEGDFLYLLELQRRQGRERERAATFNSYGVFLVDEGRAAEAESAFRQATALDSTNASTYVNLGNLLSDHGRMAEAESAYRRATRLDSLSAAAYYDLGLLFLQSDRAGEAEEALRRAARLEPADPDALRQLILALERNGKMEEAKTLRLHLEKLVTETTKTPLPTRAPSLKEFEDSPD